MKKLVFYYLFVGLLVSFMLVSTSSVTSTSRTIIEYGSFPFTDPLLSQEFHFNWCAFACITTLKDAKGENLPLAICEIASLYAEHTRGQIFDCCNPDMYNSNGYYQRG